MLDAKKKEMDSVKVCSSSRSFLSFELNARLVANFEADLFRLYRGGCVHHLARRLDEAIPVPPRPNGSVRAFPDHQGSFPPSPSLPLFASNLLARDQADSRFLFLSMLRTSRKREIRCSPRWSTIKLRRSRLGRGRRRLRSFTPFLSPSLLFGLVGAYRSFGTRMDLELTRFGCDLVGFLQRQPSSKDREGGGRRAAREGRGRGGRWSYGLRGVATLYVLPLFLLSCTLLSRKN